MKNKIGPLIKILESLINCKVIHIYLLIWPDDSGKMETDIRLHLVLKQKIKGEIQNLTFAIEPDGQTPLIINEKITVDYDLNLLEIRKNEWCKQEYWSTNKEIKYEVFDTSASDPYNTIIGRSIIDITILYVENQIPMGIGFDFGEGQKIWSIPGITRNTVTTDINNIFFPLKIEKISIKKIQGKI